MFSDRSQILVLFSKELIDNSVSTLPCMSILENIAALALIFDFGYEKGYLLISYISHNSISSIISKNLSNSVKLNASFASASFGTI